MTERLSLGNVRFAKNQQDALNEISRSALKTVDKTYGTGYPDFTPGRCSLEYHNGHHARLVGRDAVKMAVKLGLSSAEQAISQTAGHAHDIIQRNGRSIDEQQSADWLEEQLRRKNVFPEAALRIGSLAISGTEPIFKNGVIAGHMASHLTYPSKSAEQVAKGVACADMGEMFVPEGPFLAHSLYKEINGYSHKSKPPIDEKLVNFQRNQVKTTEIYRYPLRQADKTLTLHKPKVVKYINQVYQQLERGDIESWDQLIEQDKAFIRDC